jgi:hypothetical protein
MAVIILMQMKKGYKKKINKKFAINNFITYLCNGRGGIT